MTLSWTQRHPVVVGIATLLLLAFARTTAAALDCIPIFYPYAEGPVLGVVTTLGPAELPLDVPSNCAFLQGSGLTDDMGAVVSLESNPYQMDMWVPTMELPAGTYNFVDGSPGGTWTLVSTGEPDVEVPSEPVLTGVAYYENESGGGCSRTTGTCGPTYAEFEIERERVEDDATPDEAITLAFYFGDSVSEAEATEERILVAAGNNGVIRLPATLGSYFSVSAIDLAGNESTRTPAVSYLPNTGCGLTRTGDLSGLALFGIAAVLLSWRRRRHLTIICNRPGPGYPAGRDRRPGRSGPG